MPYKYIGRKTSFKGKTLWEIVGNLKNFGIGRIFVRSIQERYPEPSYCKILKVEPMTCPENQNLDNLRKVRVTVERTFRGVTQPKPVKIVGASYKSDYRLIPKDEEENIYKKIASRQDSRIFPRTMDFPPILKEVILREKKANNENLEEELKLEIIYRANKDGKFRIAKDGEKPTVEVNVNMTELPDVSMYKNIKVST